MDEKIQYWSKQEIWTKDGLHYRLKGIAVAMDFSPTYDDLHWMDRYSPTRIIAAPPQIRYTWRILEGPLANVIGVDGVQGQFSTDSFQDAIDAGFFELVAPIKH